METVKIYVHSNNVLGSADFLGYQMYTSSIIEAKASPLFPSYYDADRDISESQDPAWKGYVIKSKH